MRFLPPWRTLHPHLPKRMRLHRALLPLLTVLTALSSATWTPSHAQTLMQALASAYQTSPDLAAQRAALRALEEGVNEARAGWRPTLAINTGAARRTNTTTLRQGAAHSSSATPKDLRLVASQPLWNGMTGPAVEAAQARVLQGQAAVLQREQSVLLAGAQAYLEVLQNRELVRLNQTNQRALEQQVEYRREFFERKLGTRTELAQAQARNALALAQLQRAQNLLIISEGAFQRTTGSAPQELSVPNSLPALAPQFETILAAAGQNEPSVRSAYYAVQAARADVDTASGSLKPSAQLDLSHAWSRDPGANLRSQRDALVQVSINIPLYQGGAEWARIRASTERHAQAQAQLDSTRLNVRQEATDAWYRLMSAQAEISAVNAAVSANEVAYEGVRSQYDVLGELSLLEVLNARQELFTSQLTLVQARVQAALSHLQLLAVQGLLSAEHLELAVPVVPVVPVPVPVPDYTR